MFILLGPEPSLVILVMKNKLKQTEQTEKQPKTKEIKPWLIVQRRHFQVKMKEHKPFHYSCVYTCFLYLLFFFFLTLKKTVK